jgi:hypothetical protein
MTEKLELRMYGLVPYNISPIQQGIQFGHAVVDYGQMAKTLSTEHPNIISQYDDWANNWKTFIILNGGTTNKSLEYTGTLNNHFATLIENGITCHPFYEPDLGHQLTSVVFIVDERVFNRTKYPDYNPDMVASINPWKYKREYNKWVKSIGGEKNLFLRNFLNNFRLA